MSNSNPRDTLRKQIQQLGLDAELTRTLLEAVEHGSDQEIVSVGERLRSFRESTPALIAEPRAAHSEDSKEVACQLRLGKAFMAKFEETFRQLAK